MTYSDRDLLDYLNGTLDEGAAETLEHMLASDPDLEKRLLALDPLFQSVTTAFENYPPDDRLQSLRDRLTVDPAWSAPMPVWKRPLSAAVAAGIAGLVAGAALFAGIVTGPAPHSDWHHQVAAYQALYVPDTVLNIKPTPESLSEQFRIAENAIDLDLNSGVLANLEPLTLKRAQVLGYNGAPLIQIAFSLPDGTPVAFCIIRQNDGEGGTDAKYAEMEGLASATWATDTHGFMLIGGDDEAAIKAIAQRLIVAFRS